MQNAKCKVCESEKEVRLYQGKTLLCGKHREQMRRFGKIRERTMTSPNIFKTSGRYNPVALQIFIYDNQSKLKGIALVDWADASIVEKFKWCIDGQGYVMCGSPKPPIKLHQLIMGKAPKGTEIDHINGNKLDNRRINLRFVTHQHNTINRKARGIFHRSSGKWSAYINKRWLGTFETKNEAQKVRQEAEKELWGDIKRV